MKKEILNRLEIVRMAAAVAVVFFARNITFAQSDSSQQIPPPRPPGGHGFLLGVCVDQTVTAKGLKIPLPPTRPSDDVKAAIDDAIKTCIASLPQPPPPTATSTTTTTSAN